MSEIDIIHDYQSFLDEITRLLKVIQKEEDRRTKEYVSIGVSVPERISYQDLDLSQYRREMLTIHKTLQWRGHNSRLNLAEKKQARRVAIAGICELIKDEYVGRFWDMYERFIGWRADSTVYNWIWEKGFTDEGIELVYSDYRREFVQTLVMQSGVPKNRAAEIINFFEIYWRYLRGMDVYEVIRSLELGHEFTRIPRHDRLQLRSLAADASEFSRAFALAVSRLSRVFEFIAATEDVVGGDIDDWADTIHRVTGVDPLTILRDRKQLRRLFNRLLGIVTPEKLRRILQAKPPGTSVKLPDGKNGRSDSIGDIQLGQYRVDGVLFTCQPTLDADLEFIASRPVNQIAQLGNALLLRSRSEIYPVINDRIRADLVYRLFWKGKDHGYVFYCVKKKAEKIHIRSKDGKVNSTFSGGDGFVCYPYFTYQGNFQKSTHDLYLRVNSVILNAADYKSRKIRVLCDKDEIPFYEGVTGKDGRIACSERSVLLENPEPGEIIISVADTDTGGPVLLDGTPAQEVCTLPETMLFSPYSHRQILPRKNDKPFQFGSRRFVLYAVAGGGADSIKLENCKVEEETTSGAYRIFNIVWEQQSQPCRILFTSEQEASGWTFEKYFHCNLYVNRNNNHFPAHVVYRDDQGNRPSDFNVVMNPVPTEEIQKKLFWNIVFNDSPPRNIPLIHFSKGVSVGKSLNIPGDKFEDMLQHLWHGPESGNGTLEISVCTADETLASRKIYIFPNINVQLPEGVQHGETFSAQVYLGRRAEYENVPLKNPLGRSKVKVRFTFQNGKWRLQRQLFKGNLELASMNTVLKVEAEPPYSAVHFGNREKGKAEPVRDIYKREFGPYDLLIADPSNNVPSVRVNRVKQNLLTKIDGHGWYIPMTRLEGVVKKENSVTVRTSWFEKSFLVKYRVALLALKAQKYLFERTATGICSFRGPVNSHVELCLTAFSGNNRPVDSARVLLKPEGKVIRDGNFSIKLPDDIEPKDLERCELVAVLVEDSVTNQSGYEYGERWEVLPETALDQRDFDYLKGMISELLNSRKPFGAAKHLSSAKKIAPDSEQRWVTETEKTVKNMLVQSSLNRVAIQVAKVLQEEYLFDV